MHRWLLAMVVIPMAAPVDMAAECVAAKTTTRVQVTIEPPDGVGVAGCVIAVTYAQDKLVIPGRGTAAGRAAVDRTPEGAVTASDDRDGELRQVVGKANALPPGPLFEVTFRRCEGAGAPGAADVSCRVIDASDPMSTKVGGVRCTISTSS
jgi:hypothetical protein